MKGIKVLGFLWIFLFSTLAIGQVNYEEVKNTISNTESESFYPTLLQRFQDSDSTLTLEDFQLIYYGSVFQKSYDPDKLMNAERQIRLANYSGEYLEAYELADSLLKEYPTSIQAYFEKAYASFNLKRFEEEAYNTKRYKILIRTIMSSGDGKTFETAYHANIANDEYEVLKFLQLEYKEESELEHDGKLFDVFSLKPNKLKLKSIYFNVSRQNRED